MKPCPRALYVELKRRFNGANNGKIILSHRDAALLLNVSRNTATAYFQELAARGFIRMTQAPHLGPSGIGQASHWALEELPTPDGRPAGKAFTRWRAEQKPRAKAGTPRPNGRDGGATAGAVSRGGAPTVGTQTPPPGAPASQPS